MLYINTQRISNMQRHLLLTLFTIITQTSILATPNDTKETVVDKPKACRQLSFTPKKSISDKEEALPVQDKKRFIEAIENCLKTPGKKRRLSRYTREIDTSNSLIPFNSMNELLDILATKDNYQSPTTSDDEGSYEDSSDEYDSSDSDYSSLFKEKALTDYLENMSSPNSEIEQISLSSHEFITEEEKGNIISPTLPLKKRKINEY